MLSCAHPRVLHPSLTPSGVHPSWLGLEMGHLWALCTLGSFKSQLLGGFLCLSPSTGEQETPLLSSALLLLPQLSVPLSSQGHRPGPLGSTLQHPGGLWGATWCLSLCPPERKNSDGAAELQLGAVKRLQTRLSPQGRFFLLLNAPPQIKQHPGTPLGGISGVTAPAKGPSLPAEVPTPGLSPARGCSPKTPSPDLGGRLPHPHIPYPPARPPLCGPGCR